MNEAPSQSSPPNEPAAGLGRRRFNFWRWFWLSFLVVSLAYAWYCFYVPSNSIAWAGSFASAQQQAARSGKPTILFFTGAWCVPCRIMKRTVWADEQVAALVNAQFVAVMIDVDDPGASEAVGRYAVGPTPNTIITDPQGKVLQQRSGGMGKAEFLELLGQAKPPGAESAP